MLVTNKKPTDTSAEAESPGRPIAALKCGLHPATLARATAVVRDQVTSRMDVIVNPTACKARSADLRPAPDL